MPSSHPLIRGTHPTHVVHSHTRADSRSRSRTAAGPQLDLAPFTFARTTANQHLPAAGKFMTIHHARRIVPKEQQHPRLLPRPIRTPEPTTASRLAFGHLSRSTHVHGMPHPMPPTLSARARARSRHYHRVSRRSRATHSASRRRTEAAPSLALIAVVHVRIDSVTAGEDRGPRPRWACKTKTRLTRTHPYACARHSPDPKKEANALCGVPNRE